MKNNRKNKPFNSDLEGGDKRFDHIVPIQVRPLEVKVYDNFDRALKAFRALVQKERVVSNYKEKQRYEKPSDKKRRKRNERKRKALDLLRRDDYNSKQPKRDKVKSKAMKTTSEPSNGN